MLLFAKRLVFLLFGCSSIAFGALSGCEDIGETEEIIETESASNSLTGGNHKAVAGDAMADYNLIAAASLKETSVYSDIDAVDDEEGLNPRQSSPYHFLNCYWDDSTALIEDQLESAVDDAVTYHSTLAHADLNRTFTHLGYMTHAIGDFYAHSNWVETHDADEQVDFASGKPSGWNSALYSKTAEDPVPPPLEVQQCNALPHSEMTKDSAPGYLNGFQEAYDDAVITTGDYIQDFVVDLYLASADYTAFRNTMVELGFYHATDIWEMASVIKYPSYFYFFFTNGMYFRFIDNSSGFQVDTSNYPNRYPMPVTDHWTGLWDGTFDAATDWSNGYAYFFKGNQYTKMALTGHTTVAGYPKPIVGTGSGWKNWPSSWADGNIDAAVMWSNGYAYFFRGSEYIKVALSNYTVVSGYPKPIVGTGSGWRDWPSSFSSDIDGAFTRNDSYAYFYKGDQYIRVNLSNYTVSSSSYPLTTKAHWPGL